jgi:hypothetical protein
VEQLEFLINYIVTFLSAVLFYVEIEGRKFWLHV